VDHKLDDFSDKLQVQVLNWTWTLGQLFQQQENEKVTAAINRLHSKISGKFDT
jgi:hypothetical protein